MTYPLNDETYMKEQAAQRDHEIRLAEVEREKAGQLAQIEANNKSDKRMSFCVALGIIAVATLLGSLGWAILSNNEANRQKGIIKHEQEQTTIQECIRIGNIWHDGDCLITRR